MLKILIPKYKAVEAENSKNYYVYVIQIYYQAKLYDIQRRYSAFHRLYKEIEKSFILSNEFPPKRIRNTSNKVLEMRRCGLEAWLQTVLTICPVPKCVLEFLDIKDYEPFMTNLKGQETVSAKDSIKKTHHKPMLMYERDPFCQSDNVSDIFSITKTNTLNTSFNHSLPNIVIEGVLIAFYDTSFDTLI